ncbi:hypothetical protein ACFOHT_04770 [Massilia oculi]|uniref:DUF1376 domain-containing protein n=1 Tax=Massilia oculi TaxID=945844 RepID=A0A2S2DDG3_9BURK|nr:hypothetical protein [Massilia oculi]AWL03384.1 hypothetical protein DIR46_02235 [Massilia oculi]
MAGEWIKFEANTPEKQEVFTITVAMGWDDPDLTVGKLLKVWRWFDQQTVNGNAPRVTAALMDRIIGVTGFAQAMCDVGWLIADEHGISLPNFERHNGQTAKNRALTAKRVAKHKGNAKDNDEGNADSVTAALPKEEKRREQKKEPRSKAKPAPAAPTFDPGAELASLAVSPQIATDWLALRKTKRAAVTPTALKNIIAEAGKAGLSLEAALSLCCTRGWAGFEAEWVLKDQRAGPAPAYQTSNDKAKAWADSLTGKNRSHEPDNRIIDLNDAPARKLG